MCLFRPIRPNMNFCQEKVKMLTEKQKEKIKECVLAGLSFSDTLRLLCDAPGQRAALEILAFPEFHRARAQARLDYGKVIHNASMTDPEFAKFWLTHIGGWSLAKPFEFNGQWTIEATEAFLEQLERHRDKLLAGPTQKLLNGKNDT